VGILVKYPKDVDSHLNFLLAFELRLGYRSPDIGIDASGNITPTAVVNGNVVTGGVIEIPNLYETHHVIAEARMDMAGMQISPPDLSSQTLLPGQSIRFFWSIRPSDVGLYRGTVWRTIDHGG